MRPLTVPTAIGFFPTSQRPRAIEALESASVPCRVLQVRRTGASGSAVIVDREGLVAKRYDARDGTAILFRPDQHVCARWRRFDLDRVRAAIARATANG